MAIQTKPLPPLDVVAELLSYNPESGAFTWKKRTGGKVTKGSPAGCVYSTTHGRNLTKRYVMIKIQGSAYAAHRLAWLLTHGVDPGEQIVDHINQDSLDNSIANLRLVSPSENNWNNICPQGNSTSKRRGVYFHKQSGKWAAEINMHGKKKHIGTYATLSEAESAYASEYNNRLSLIS